MDLAMGYWDKKRVTVTGGNGFLGSHIVEKLAARNCLEILVTRSAQYDLRDRDAVTRMFQAGRPDVLLHLAAVVGGIGANQLSPAQFFYDNALMGIQLIEEGRKAGVGKIVVVGTTCSYPKNIPTPFREENYWNGYPEETNAPYGLAKKMLTVQAQAYHHQYGMNVINPILSNLYGPRDNFDLEKSHVIPALIRKFSDGKEGHRGSVTLWGTGTPTRDFLYVEDAAEGVLLAAEHVNTPDPVNIGSGEELAIRDLAGIIAELTGFEGKILWDASRPDGQPRRCLDIRRAQRLFGFHPTTSLREGLLRTMEWYRQNQPQITQAFADKK